MIPSWIMYRLRWLVFSSDYRYSRTSEHYEWKGTRQPNEFMLSTVHLTLADRRRKCHWNNRFSNASEKGLISFKSQLIRRFSVFYFTNVPCRSFSMLFTQTYLLSPPPPIPSIQPKPPPATPNGNHEIRFCGRNEKKQPHTHYHTLTHTYTQRENSILIAFIDFC